MEMRPCGQGFIAIHEPCYKVAAAVEEYSDMIAERAGASSVRRGRRRVPYPRLILARLARVSRHTMRPRHLTAISRADIAAKPSKPSPTFGPGAVTTTSARRLPIWSEGPLSKNDTLPKALVNVRL